MADGAIRLRGVAKGFRRRDEQVQALEGSPAYISTGSLQPLASRNVARTPGGGVIVTESVNYRDVSTGFEVVPRVAGDRVILSDMAGQEQASRVRLN